MPLAAPVLGALVGLVLALTGAGGAILAVPLLVFGLDLAMAQAAPVGLLAVALAAGLGAYLGWRERALRYKAAALMAAMGLLASPAGLWVAHRLPNVPLMVLFAMTLAVVAWRTLHRAGRELRGEPEPRPQVPPCRLDLSTGKLHWTLPCARSLAAAGAAAGFLSGLLGVGGGFVIVPTLLAVSDLPMKTVVATSMGVLVLVSLGGVVGAGVSAGVPWPVALPFAAGAVGGLLAGRLFTARLAGPRLQQGFAALCAAVALGLVWRALA